MKLDAFMPFYGSEFFQATQCMPDEVALKYLRCCWFYWSHTKCSGLRDDDGSLRRLCRCSCGEWPAVKEMIFNGEFFTLEAGLWHQKRCQKEFKAAMERVAQCVQAAKTRWSK